MKKVSILVLAALFTLPAFAAKPVTFVATEDISYDDNIYLKNGNDKKDSFISTTRVGANYKGQVPSSDLKLTAGALAGYNAYTEKPGQNNYWDALGNVELANEQFKLGDRLLYTSDPANNALTDRAKRLNNDAYVSLKTTNKKPISVGVSVQDVLDRYFQGAWAHLNRNRFNAGVQGYYNFNTKTNVFVEYIFSDIVYQKNGVSNSTGHTIGLGVNGQIAPKVNGTAKVTYAMRDYSRDVVGAENNPDLFGYYVSLTWKATAKDTVTLSGERKMEETLYGINRYFADTLVSVKGQHRFNSKWAASLLLGWEDMSYSREVVPGNKRHDTLFTVRPGVDYIFKDWLMAGVWYQYRTRESNNNTFDYENNKAGITVKALF